MDPPAGATSSTSTGTGDVVRDNYIPLFDGRPSSYREYRKRITLYMKKMRLIKKTPEGIINILTSFTGAVWKQVEHLSDSAPEAEDGFEQVLLTLDRIYQYDSKVEMPRAFEKFFYQVSRGPGQTLMSYVSDHRDAARELEKYDVKLPPTVLGWLLVRRAGLSTEQRQLIMSQVPKDLKPEAVEESLYFLFGQDYKGRSTNEPVRNRNVLTRPRPQTARWARNWRSSSATYTAEDDGGVDDYFEDPAEYDEALKKGPTTRMTTVSTMTPKPWIWTRLRRTRPLPMTKTRTTWSMKRPTPATLMPGGSLQRYVLEGATTRWWHSWTSRLRFLLGKGRASLAFQRDLHLERARDSPARAARNPPSRAANPLLHPAPMPLGVSGVDRLDTGPPSAHALLRLRLPRHPHHLRHSQSVNVKEKP